jgi:DNA-binding NtrC family response regulator
MKEKENISENQSLHSLYIRPETYLANREGSRSFVQSRDEKFIGRHDRLSEDFWNLVQKFPFKELMDRLEQTILISALNKFDGNQRKTAKFLGMKPTTLYEKIKKHNISIRKIPSQS